MSYTRILDYIFFLYFLTHIPITMLIDSQAIFPKSWYPQVLVNTIEWYCREFKDPMMVDPPAWFKSFCICEVLVQFPFFFIGAYAFLKGNCRWIRIPALVYGTHVATTVIPIISHVLYHDFSTGQHPGPSTDKERYRLAAIYSPYFIIPVMMVLRMIFSPEYQRVTSVKSHKKNK